MDMRGGTVSMVRGLPIDAALLARRKQMQRDDYDEAQGKQGRIGPVTLGLEDAEEHMRPVFVASDPAEAATVVSEKPDIVAPGRGNVDDVRLGRIEVGGD